MTSPRRQLGPGPQSPNRPVPALALETRDRVVATQADLYTEGLEQLRLPDLQELRARGVLGGPPLGD